MNNIRFDNPQLFLLLIVFAIVLIVPFIIFVKKKNFNNISSLIIHLIIAFLLTTLLTKVNIVKVKTDTEVYVLADLSKSIADYQQVDDCIDKIKKSLPEKEKLGVICFGKDSEVLTPLGGNLKSVLESKVDTSSTDYYQVLKYTISLFSSEYKNRIILISDGLETDDDCKNIISELTSNEIRLDIVYLNDAYLKENEVLIKDVDFVSSTFASVVEKANVNIISNYQTNNLKIKIYENSELYKEEIISVNSGTNIYSFTLDTSKEAINNYYVIIEDNDDTLSENNKYYFSQKVTEKSNILLIANNYKEANYYSNVLKNGANLTTLQVSQYFPLTVEYFCQFDQIALANINLNSISNSNKFQEVLNTVVASYGKSLITFGGDNTYLNGNFTGSTLEEMLPVELNPKDTKDSAAIILLIDNSGSMSGSRLESAKQGAIDCLELLDDNDLVGVITFSSSTQVICSPTYATSEGKRKLVSAIRKIGESDDTMMTPGLKKSFDLIKGVSLTNKEVILISDGMPGDTGQIEIAEQMKEKNIILSTINIGGGANVSLMKTLASTTGGTFYDINSSEDIASVIIKEVSEIVLEPIIENNLSLTLKDNETILEGISSLPNIKGCHYTSLKNNAYTSITTSTTLSEPEKFLDNIPIYAYWDYGNGKVASFLSGVSNDWLDNWQNDVNVNKFYENMILDTLPYQHIDSAYVINVENNGYSSKISLQTPSINNKTKYSITITSPNNENESIVLSYNSGKYEGFISTTQEGNYKLKLEITNGTSYSSYETYFDFSYSKEYLLSSPDSIKLYTLLVNDGKLIDNLLDIEQITNIEINDSIYKKQIILPQIIICLVLFIIDIAIRKIRFKDFKNLFKRKKRIED